MHTKYVVKTLLYGITPGGYGHVRRLKQQHDPSYNHERDKHPVRERHNSKLGWNKGKSVIEQRDYQNYDEYRLHQAQKFDEILKMRGGFPARTIVTFRQRFYRRFRHLPALLPSNATILCLGARQGTEVEVLRDIGFKNAFGIDLNPGPDNPFVKPGDFMHLDEVDSSVDLIYTNCVDHAFNLENFIAEQRRVLKPDGYALYDLPRYSGTRSPGAFEAIGWNAEDTIINTLKNSYRKTIRSEQETKWQWILFQGPTKN